MRVVSVTLLSLTAVAARPGYCNGEASDHGAFAAMRSNGEVVSWPSRYTDGVNTFAPFDSIRSIGGAWAALKTDGTMKTWNTHSQGSTPTDDGWIRVVGNGEKAYAALHSTGKVTSWGSSSRGGTGAPSGTNFAKLFGSAYGFVALSPSGHITYWGNAYSGGSSTFAVPTDGGYVHVYTNYFAFAAMKADGTITTFGNAARGGSNGPPGVGWVEVYDTEKGFVARDGLGRLFAWGSMGPSGIALPSAGYEPAGTFTNVWTTNYEFTAQKTTGELITYPDPSINPPAGTDFVQIVAGGQAFAALSSTGHISCWGHWYATGTSSSSDGAPPTGGGFVSMATNMNAFAALDGQGRITTWGNNGYGGTHYNPTTARWDGWIGPSPPGYTSIGSNFFGFAALHSDGSLTPFGGGGPERDLPAGNDFVFLHKGVSMNNGCGSGSGSGGANGDPHLTLPHGGTADFRGEHKSIYNLLSAQRLSLNVMTELADFELHELNHSRHKSVHGSFLTQAHIVARTSTGKIVRISYWADKITQEKDPGGHFLNQGWANGTVDSEPAFALKGIYKHKKVIDDVLVQMSYSSLHVLTPEFEVVVTPHHFRLERNVVGLHHRLDIQIKPRVAEAAFAVPPHGIIGQGWDGDDKAIDGEHDAFPVSGEFTTYAMAKGAIEGVPNDYKVATKYATDFKFSRFDATSGEPRNVANLVAAGELNAPKTVFGSGVVGSTEITEEKM